MCKACSMTDSLSIQLHALLHASLPAQFYKLLFSLNLHYGSLAQSLRETDDIHSSMHLGGRDEEPRGSFRIGRMPNCLRQAFVAGLLLVPPVAGGHLGNRDSQRLHGVCGSEINDPVQDESNRHQQARTQRPPGEASRPALASDSTAAVLALVLA